MSRNHNKTLEENIHLKRNNQIINNLIKNIYEYNHIYIYDTSLIR